MFCLLLPSAFKDGHHKLPVFSLVNITEILFLYNSCFCGMNGVLIFLIVVEGNNWGKHHTF